MREIQANLHAGRCAVYDADLSSYCDTIPHDKLVACVRMRVVDGGILALLRAWLQAPVVEPSEAMAPLLSSAGGAAGGFSIMTGAPTWASAGVTGNNLLPNPPRTPPKSHWKLGFGSWEFAEGADVTI